MFGGRQVRVVHERGGVKRTVPWRYKYNVGRPGAKSITRELYRYYRDGIYHFILWSGEFDKRTFEPRCEEIFRVQIENGRLRFLRPEHARPWIQFFR